MNLFLTSRIGFSETQFRYYSLNILWWLSRWKKSILFARREAQISNTFKHDRSYTYIWYFIGWKIVCIHILNIFVDLVWIGIELIEQSVANTKATMAKDQAKRRFIFEMLIFVVVLIWFWLQWYLFFVFAISKSSYFLSNCYNLAAHISLFAYQLNESDARDRMGL